MSAENEDLDIPGAPEIAVWPPPPTNTPLPPAPTESDPILSFPHQSVWLLLLLTVITFGIYTNVWLLRQAIRLERFLSDGSLRGYMIGGVICACVSAAFDAATIFTDNAVVTNISSLLDKGYLVVVLIAAFGVRNRLNTVQQGYTNRVCWFSGGWTFLFGVLYLQYKINKNRTLRQQIAEMPLNSSTL